MSRSHRAPSELLDAAAVHAARERIVRALGPLAARPLDEGAAERMREALARNESPEIRAAVRRLGTPRRPHLVVVPTLGEDELPRGHGEPHDGGRGLPQLALSGGDAA